MTPKLSNVLKSKTLCSGWAIRGTDEDGTVTHWRSGQRNCWSTKPDGHIMLTNKKNIDERIKELRKNDPKTTWEIVQIDLVEA